jgi:hypothetical protein
MSMQALMNVPPAMRDVQWLAYSLQEAIQLEWSTIPPYLCAYWSVKTDRGVPATTLDISSTLQSIVVEEMLHMSLACNMLVGIGGTPNIYSANFAPKYPGQLPGHVNPNLIVGLAGLAKDVPGCKDQVYKFVQIEWPETDPLATLRAPGYHTIGEFYDAVSQVFDRVAPAIVPDRQLTNMLMPDLAVITNVADAKAKIDLIKRQGEGTACSPFASDGSGRIATAPELAHFYRFGEIHAGFRLAKDASAPHGWSYSGVPLPFPDEHDLYLMAEVPAAGYAPESDDFDRKYTAVLKLLYDAWAQGDGNKLQAAIDSMDNDLTPTALSLLTAGHPTGSGKGIKGPDFRFLP